MAVRPATWVRGELVTAESHTLHLLADVEPANLLALSALLSTPGAPVPTPGDLAWTQQRRGRRVVWHRESGELGHCHPGDPVPDGWVVVLGLGTEGA